MSKETVPLPPCEATPADPVSAADRVAFLKAVTRLVHAHRAKLAEVARYEGLTADDAFDAVQEAFETFLVLPQAPGSTASPDEARRLLVTLTRNVARNRRRLHAVARPHISDQAVLEDLPVREATIDELLVAAEDHARLSGCMRTLAQLQRVVVTLRMLDGVPGEDVARALGLTPGHVAVLLYRAKAHLLACLTEAKG